MQLEKDPSQQGRFILSIDNQFEWNGLAQLSFPPISLGRFILNNKIIKSIQNNDYPRHFNLSGFEAVRVAKLIAKPLRSEIGRIRLSSDDETVTKEMALTAANFLDRKKEETI